MIVEQRSDDAVSRIAAAIGEPARARILYCLMGNRARTSTELAMVADVAPSTASVHLNRLRAEGLVAVHVQGKHRYYRLAGPDVARVLESLSVLAGGSRSAFVPSTPEHLRAARTCYDHLAGTLGVALHDRLLVLGWIRPTGRGKHAAYDLTPGGIVALEAIGISMGDTGARRRRFAYPCLDWSERRSHIGGSLGAALLAVAMRRRWLAEANEHRALRLTALGKRELAARFGLTDV